MCVSTCQVDYVLLRTCFALNLLNCGVDFWNSGDFSLLQRTVLLLNYLAEGRKSAGTTISKFCEQNLQANHLGGIQTHDLNTARADVLPLDHRASPVARSSLNLSILGVFNFALEIKNIISFYPAFYQRCSNHF